jgi:hypothetical protein
MKDVAAVYAQIILDGKSEPVRQLMQDKLSPMAVPVEGADAFFTRKDRETVVKLENERTKLDSTHPGTPPRAMVLVDKPKPSDVRVFVRGNPARQGDPAPRAWLTMFGGEKFTDGSGRLELAQHIASKDNPLTARVIVNRVWMQHFGKPLVAQPSDFGVQTLKPIHAELLDYLAASFMENGWSLKKLHTLILSSRTWQQSSHASPEKLTKDADNELVSRFNRQRLDYEVMRDTLLNVTGELQPATMGGRAVELNAKDADTRRSLYLKVDRYDQPSVPAMFDFANPGSHSPQRFNTTVPQQALFLMNSPFMRERADAVAKATPLKGTTLDSEAIRAVYHRILARDPKPDEVELAQRFAADATDLNGEKPFRWSYGSMTLTRDAEGKPVFNDFQAFAHFTERSGGGQRLWSPGPKIPAPDPKWGHAFWANYGGHAAPGDRAVMARWHVPTDLKVTIDATLPQQRPWRRRARLDPQQPHRCRRRIHLHPAEQKGADASHDGRQARRHPELHRSQRKEHGQRQLRLAAADHPRRQRRTAHRREKRLLWSRPLAHRPRKASAAPQPARASAPHEQRVHVCGVRAPSVGFSPLEEHRRNDLAG